MNHYALIPAWLLNAGLSDGALRLYAEYAAHDGHNDALPLRALARRMNCSKATVLRRRSELETAGAVVLHKTDRQPTVVAVRHHPESRNA